MKRVLLLCLTLAGTSALAADDEDAAQRKADDAAVKACQVAKDHMSKQEACADEYGQMSAVICSDKESRESVDYKKLGAECTKKAKTTVKAKAPAAKAPAKKKK